MEHTKKCEHPSCVCQVGTGIEYCSTFCSGQADTPDIVCSCGHTTCAEAPDTVLRDRKVTESVYVAGVLEVTPSQ